MGQEAKLRSLTEIANELRRPLTTVTHWASSLGLEWMLGEDGKAKLFDEQAFARIKEHASQRKPINSPKQQYRERQAKLAAS